MSTHFGVVRTDYGHIVHTEDAGHTGRRVTNAPAPSFTEWDHHQIERGWHA
jgi:hypothetical protein